MASLSLQRYVLCALVLIAQLSTAASFSPLRKLWPERNTHLAVHQQRGELAADHSNKTDLFDGNRGRASTPGGSWWGHVSRRAAGLMEGSLRRTVLRDIGDAENPAPQTPMHICIMTGDVYGTSEMGGTATAFWHLSNLLRDRMVPRPKVTWIALETPIQSANCTELRPLYNSHGFDIICLEGARSWSVNPFRQAGWNALLWLRSQAPDTCDILHSHEWGGVLHALIQSKLLGEFPSMHVNVIPHGGHMWSRDTALTVSNVIDKEIDYDERFVLETADSVVSPSNYMVDYLRQERGWKLNPSTTCVIGNVQSAEAAEGAQIDGAMASADPSEVRVKPFTNVVFFGRLEARKGLHLFISAVGSIPQHNDPNFKVSFIGSDPTKKRGSLLADIKRSWRCQVNILIGLARHEALKALQALSQSDGVLVVMPSIIDNQPFTVAEVALAGLPMLAFDVGGIGEMLTPATRAKTLIAPDSEALRVKLELLATAGEAAVPILDPRVMLASKMWLNWHRSLNFTSPAVEVVSAKRSPSPARGAIRAAVETVVTFLSRQSLFNDGARSLPRVEQPSTSSDFISSMLGGRLLKVDLSQRRRIPKSELIAVCADLEANPLVEAVALVTPDLRPLATLSGDAEHPLAHMFSTLGLSAQSRGLHAVTIGVEVTLQDGIQTQTAFPSGPSFVPRVQRGDMCLLFVPAMFRKEAFCAALERTAESSISEGWVAKTLAESTRTDSLLVATIQQVRYTVNISSSVIYPCNNPNVSPGQGRISDTSSDARPRKGPARRVMTRELLQVGQPAPSVVVSGTTPGREYSCNMVSYVGQQAPNYCNTPGGAIQYCCEYPTTCSVASLVPRCSDDTPPPRAAVGPVLPGVVPGKEYSCVEVPYVNSQSPTYCNTPGGALQYCCPYPTACADTNGVPRCSGDPPAPQITPAPPAPPSPVVGTPSPTVTGIPTPVPVLNGTTPGKEYDCSKVPFVNGQSPTHCNTPNGTISYCCPYPSTCLDQSDVPRCSTDPVPGSLPRAVVLSGAVVGQEYACGIVPYSQNQSPRYCITSTFQQFCCAFPTNCVLFSSVPACAA